MHHDAQLRSSNHEISFGSIRFFVYVVNSKPRINSLLLQLEFGPRSKYRVTARMLRFAVRCTQNMVCRSMILAEWLCRLDSKWEHSNHGRMNYKKTPNPIWRLFFKIDLFTDFAALCLTDFIDWRYIHSWLVFSTQLVNCCPHGRRNYTCVLLSLYLLSDLPPPPQTKCTEYSDNV